MNFEFIFLFNSGKEVIVSASKEDYEHEVVFDNRTFILQFIDDTKNPIELYYTEIKEEENSKCECGSTAVGSSSHSTWCPKFTKDYIYN